MTKLSDGRTSIPALVALLSQDVPGAAHYQALSRANSNTGLVLQLTFYTALMIGLLGSTHCIGMCGGIVGALNLHPAQSSEPTRSSRMARHLTYNTGRILSYTLAGALAGLIGAQATRLYSGTALPVGRVIAGLFMIALGLYLAGWWRAFSGIEKAGLPIWRFIEPRGRRFLPARTRWQIFGIGLVWGWLPCGLVYSTLALAVASASARQGALLMLGFGLGTLPMLLAMGNFAGHLRKLVRYPAVRQIAGAVIMLFGAYTCAVAFSDDGHRHSGANHRVEACSLDQARYLV